MQGENVFINRENDVEYVVKVKGRKYRWLWLLLLLLLPLLLLLRFHKNVLVSTCDSDKNQSVANVNVDFSYVDYALIKTNPFRLFATDTIKTSGVTGQDGKYTFTDVTYTLYAAIFHGAGCVDLSARQGCFASDTLHPSMSILQDIVPYVIGMKQGSVDVVFRVVDSDDNQPLASAEVEVLVKGNVKKLLTDVAGLVTVEGMELCGDVDINAQMDGYAGDTIRCDMATALRSDSSRVLRLKPGKGIVSFVVKDLESLQPIPDAVAKLVINGDTILYTTNTNGVGKGCFENISAKHKFVIEFSRVAYYDTLSPQYKVTEFERLPDDKRVFKMRPQRDGLVFRNIDSLYNTPIEGVANVISVNGQELGTLYSNRLGCFTVGNIAEGDVIEIKSSHVSYKLKFVNRKGTDVRSDNQRKRDILMSPLPIRIGKPDPDRHCGVHFSGTLLSDESVPGHISKIYAPDIYGEYVGDGDYQSNSRAFPNAVKYTFDAIAVDKNTHLTVYSKPNFQGQVLLDVDGPYLINNCKWKNDTRLGDFTTKTFSPQFESNYPPSCRHWSKSDMNAWDYGSVKITCKK
ncbi:MAG: hypothetical protein MJZ61_00970 [Bacteroidales bacterium]|nr:hypothetical protein [Bacteroidales bacterium]